MVDNKFNFQYEKFSKLKSPYKEDNREVYHLWVNIKDLPEGFPREVNPRDVKTNTKVYKKIKEALEDSTESFFVNNRGILISAKKVNINSVTNEISLDLGKKDEIEKYGVLDGGHTYHAIINHKSKIDPEINQFVHLEIMTNVTEIDELSGARNTSVQVSDKAIAELADKFDFVKSNIKNEPYANAIAYRENEDKRLDTVDLVRLMYAFNVFKYSDGNAQPIPAYSGKSQVLKDYLNNYDMESRGERNDYRYLAPLLPDITKLYEKIELEMNKGYKLSNPNGQFGKVKGVDYKEKSIKTKFYQAPTKYQITQGFIFPILSAFRALIDVRENDELEWSVDPFKVWEKSKGKLVNNTVEMSRQLGNNPQSTGKSNTLWLQNYDAVNTEKLQLQIEMYKKEN